MKEESAAPEKVKVQGNCPHYSNVMQCYVVNYSIDGNKRVKFFDTYKEGIDWLKANYPNWFKKHF